MTAAARTLLPVSEIAGMLANSINVLAPELLPGGKRQGAEWRCGSLAGERGGSLGVHLVGPKAGVWSDFSTGECGDALDLVAAVRCGGDKAEAIRWARAWLGVAAGDPAAFERQRAEAQRATDRRDAEAAAEAEAKRRSAQAMWLGARETLLGTPAEAYLRGRGIPLAEFARQPRALRYRPELWHVPSGRHWPAMVAAVHNLAGVHVATHRTYLEVLADGTVRKAPVEHDKMVLGACKGGCIRLARGASDRPLAAALPEEVVDITEGIEDALSVAWAAPESRVVAAISLSNMGCIELPAQLRAVRLWCQRDATNAALLAADRAVRQHQAAGRRVLLPHIPAGFKDVNDMIRGE